MSLPTRMFFCAALACMASPGLSAIALPTGFDGTYAPEGEACGDGGLLVTVAEGVITVMDGAMEVTDLIEDPVNPRRVDVALAISAGGGEWTDAAVMTLSDDGQSLTLDYVDGTRVTWMRCG